MFVLTLLAVAGSGWFMRSTWPLPRCGFKVVTGLPCATCGSTRALAALSEGDFAAALAWNPLVAVGCVAVAAWFVVWIWQWVRGGKMPAPGFQLSGRLIGVGISALLLNWIYLLWTLPR